MTPTEQKEFDKQKKINADLVKMLKELSKLLNRHRVTVKTLESL